MLRKIVKYDLTSSIYYPRWLLSAMRHAHECNIETILIKN